MVFPSLQLALALSCVMGLVMFARYCGEDHSHTLGPSSKDAVSLAVFLHLWFFFLNLKLLLCVFREIKMCLFFTDSFLFILID